MNSPKEKEYDYKADLSDLDPGKLATVLPRWKIEERIFVQDFRGAQLLEEQKGWILDPPYRYGGFIQIERDARRVSIRKGMNAIVVDRVREVSTKLHPAVSLILFRSSNAKLSIWVPHDERKVEVYLSSGQRYPNSVRVHMEIIPAMGLVIGSQTTLEELFNYF